MFFNIFNAKGYSPLHKSPLSPQLRGGEAVDTRGLHSPLPSLPAWYIFVPMREDIVGCSVLEYGQFRRQRWHLQD